MSCTKCKSSPCACTDHGLVNPCTYTGDCPETSEQCEEVVCEECVRQCEDYSLRITDTGAIGLADPGKLLTIGSNEPLSMTLQKILLYLDDPVCAKEDSLNGHAPYYVYITNITQTTLDINWTGWSSVTVDFLVKMSIDDGVNYIAILPAIAPTTPTMTYTVGVPVPLVPNTDYVFKVTARAGIDCDSVQIAVKTLPL